MLKVRGSLVVLGTLGLLLLGATASQAQIIFPPGEADWERNRLEREDLRPWELSRLDNQPQVDGEILEGEWRGAASYEVLASNGEFLGTLYAGTYEDYLYVATDWTVNVNPDPLFGGGNAWRVGTAIGPGEDNSGSGDWYEVFVVEDGTADGVWARVASSEEELQFGDFIPGGQFGIDAGSFFNGVNWQYELFLGEAGPGPLWECWHWEWRQIDPLPSDGFWEPVYDGSVHVPEPMTASLLALGVLLVLKRRSA